MIEPEQRAFMASRRTATLATVSGRGAPRLVPICFVIADLGPGGETVLWTPLDQKPKQVGDVRRLARVADILSRPEVTLLFERWSEDWSELAWLRARGLARLVEPHGDRVAHRTAVAALRDKYPQYRSQAIDELPLIRISLDETVSWQASPSG